jgi:hypothetical protein
MSVILNSILRTSRCCVAGHSSEKSKILIDCQHSPDFPPLIPREKQPDGVGGEEDQDSNKGCREKVFQEKEIVHLVGLTLSFNHITFLLDFFSP